MNWSVEDTYYFAAIISSIYLIIIYLLFLRKERL